MNKASNIDTTIAPELLQLVAPILVSAADATIGNQIIQLAWAFQHTTSIIGTCSYLNVKNTHTQSRYLDHFVLAISPCICGMHMS